MDIAQLVNLIATAITAKMTMTLSQQLAQAQRAKSEPMQASWLQRLARPLGLSPVVSWAERFSVGQPSRENRERLSRSQSAWNAAVQSHSEAHGRYTNAVNEFESEKANPTGKDLASLQIAIIDYEKALHEAAAKLKSTTQAHESLKTEVARQTSWQTQRTKANLWSPAQQWRKAKQQVRIVKRKWQAAAAAIAAQKMASEAHAKNEARHFGNQQKLADVRRKARRANVDLKRAERSHQSNLQRQAMTKEQIDRAPSQVLRTRAILANVRASGAVQQSAKTVATARAARVTAVAARQAATAATAASGTAVTRSATAVSRAGPAVRVAVGAAVARSAAATVGAVALPVAAAIGVVAGAVVAVKSFVNRQLQKSEQLINGQIQQRSQFNGQIANAMARYEAQEMQLNMRTGAQTANSSSAVVESTMRLKEAQQPMNAAWEDIGNRIQAAATDTATLLQEGLNKIDILTPLVTQSVKMLEYLPWVKKVAENTAKPVEGVGIDAFLAGVNMNANKRNDKRFGDIPKVR
jgi:hypothetical protein